MTMEQQAPAEAHTKVMPETLSPDGPVRCDVCGQGPRSLRCLEVGQKAQIVSVRAEGELGRRIRDMGLVPGVEVEVVGRAPLRDPVALRLPGFTLSLRNNEADHIVVHLLGEAGE